jgi:hypothetical protein
MNAGGFGSYKLTESVVALNVFGHKKLVGGTVLYVSSEYPFTNSKMKGQWMSSSLFVMGQDMIRSGMKYNFTAT